ncbi:leucine-rich repeat receptor-like serine/threonine-protein kinase BAM1 [Arachis duranensis]|uniref:Leucine-rich repeat receptor-like serine/threonine-protein kinase BAM1 n=1 Tax=Arachis duranensis TaxID=130453 RepID=A0A6P4CWT9_ARADU|nr:leucine-rich repeat receptor-like serine/threonine-protein kinase BAM1 [Arachis duranensis]
MATPHYCYSFLLVSHLFLLSAQSLDPTDFKALLSIKNTLTDVSPTTPFFSTWNLTAPDPCSSFSGVTCSFNRVTILSLGANSLSLAGSLPPSISVLTELTQLILSPGIVTGSIPQELAQLNKLRVISLSNNRFTGAIPSIFSSLKTLHTFDLSNNQLAGSVPPSLTELPQLRVLILASNSLTGDFPQTVSSPLLHLDLKNNKLTGTLPPSMPSSLRYLSVSQNQMWGPLSNGLDSLSELEFLDLSMNHFSGPIPAQLFYLPTLSSLFLQRNNLSGQLPQSPGDNGPLIWSPSYGEGSTVDLSHNSLSGKISTVFDGVESLFLNNNRFIGTVPEVYVKSMCRGSTRTLYLQHNYLTGIPFEEGTVLPDTASLCLSYNCMVPPASLMTCPASAGEQLSRPVAQCTLFNKRLN